MSAAPGAPARRPIAALHLIDKLSMDDANPSSCALLLRDWKAPLEAMDVRIAVATLRSPDPGGRVLEESGVPVRYLGRGPLSPATVRDVSRLLRREDAQVLHLHGYSAANFGRMAARLHGLPGIVHEHAVLPVRPHQWLADRVLRRWSDHAIAVSGEVRSFLIHGRSVPPERIEIIPNGVDLARFTPAPPERRGALRRELGVAPGAPLLGTVTRLREEKGNAVLLRALPALVERFADLALAIAGDGPLRGSLEALAASLGARERVHFLGFRSDVAELLSSLDLVVIPSLSEGFCLALVEAMSVGRPIVATRVGGIPEIADDGRTALLVPPGDPGALAAAIARLLEAPERARVLADEARRASAAYDVHRTAAALRDLYDRALASERR